MSFSPRQRWAPRKKRVEPRVHVRNAENGTPIPPAGDVALPGQMRLFPETLGNPRRPANSPTGLTAPVVKLGPSSPLLPGTELRAPRHSPEHDLQVAVMDWTREEAARRPELELLHAIPNGGKRGKLTARRLKREGVKRGVPDLMLPVARRGYHGLYLEMKWEGWLPDGAGGRRRYRSRPSKAQKWWAARLHGEGYAVRVCRTLEETQDVLRAYLEGRPLPPERGGRA